MSKKRRFSGRLFNENGSVTIFAAITMSALIIFFAVLIDYARIAALEVMSENALRTSARSALSAYDPLLYERFGLFGKGGTDAGTIFNEVLQGNIGENRYSSPGGFRLVQSRVDESAVYVNWTLGAHPVFARQVLEEMKYRAPIDFTLEIVQKFKPLSKQLQEAAAAVETLDEIGTLYEKREKLLEEVVELQREAAEKFRSSSSAAAVPAGDRYGRTAGLLSGWISDYRSYATWVEHDAGLPEEEEALYTSEIRGFESRTNSLASQLMNGADRSEQNHDASIHAALGKLEQARQLNSQMRAIHERSNNGHFFAGGGESADSDAEQLREIARSAEDMIRPDNFFEEYASDLDDQKTWDHWFHAAIREIVVQISSAIPARSPASIEAAMKDRIDTAKQNYKFYESRYIDPPTLIDKWARQLEDINFKQQLKEQKKESKNLWKEATNVMDGIAELNDGADSDAENIFEQVKQKYEQSVTYNRLLVQSDPQAEGREADAQRAARQSSAKAGGMIDSIGQMLEQGRDNFYYGEYAIDRFSHFDPRKFKALLEEGDGEIFSKAAKFHNQEVEYVLYGFHNKAGNLSAAYGEIFAFRMAVRTMEGLIKSKGAGHPLLVLTAAIIYGLTKAMEDMLDLVRNGSIPLSEKINIQLTYLDYLRIFMLLHGGREEQRMARMIAVIEQKSGLTLSAVPTGIAGDAQISMRLWFLPGIMRMLGELNALNGKVVGGRYETTKLVGWSY